MNTLKIFFLCLLVVVVIYFGSNFLINVALNNTYKDISSYKSINSQSIQVKINESKATSLNGYIKGNIKNISNDMIEEEYLKIDFFSKRDVNLGTKYVKIEKLKSGDSTDFEINFKFSNVEYCKITDANDTFINDIV